MAFSEQDLEEFKSEASELLDVAEKSLLSIDNGADVTVAFDAVFRCFHNLKGAAGMMELTALQAHTHELETTLMKFKNSPAIPKESVTYFLKGIDGARSLLNSDTSDTTNKVAEEKTETPSSPEITANFITDSASEEFFTECDETIERVADHLKKIESHSYSKDTIDALYRDFHSIKGAAYLFTFNALGDLAHLIESYLEPLRDGSQLPTKALINGIFTALKIIEMQIHSLRSGQIDEKLEGLTASLAQTLNKITPQPAPQTSPSPVILSTSSPQETMSTLLAELTHTHLQPPQEPPVNQSTSPAPQASPSLVSNEKENESTSIRVPVALLDSLMTLMGEMVLVRNQVLQYSNNSEDQEFANLSKRLNAVTSEIQDEMMKTRMQPIGNILHKFSRVVRDLSQELGKNTTLTLSGAETELDKSLLEAIKDPLTHIVRNSCDHGIETPDVRRQAGKPETGNISIKSFHEGGQVVIEIADDGKGLNREVLLKKGIEKGLITETQAKTMLEKEIFNLIFAPGFSTAQKVTNVSGRGVGMDVVRTNIEKIGGTVDLMSVVGHGTTIVIKIPLTLAIVPALIVNSGNGIFAIPQVKLVELVRVDQNSGDNKIEYLQGAPVYRLRGNLLPLVDLSKILGIKKEDSQENNPFVNIAVLTAKNRSFGLIVDTVQDTADIVVKPLNRLLKSLSAYSGATIMGDGSIALILDVQGLSKYAQIDNDDTSAQAQDASRSDAKSASTENQDYLLVKVNSPTKHAIVLSYVHRLEEFKRSDIELSGAKKIIRYRDSLLHIVTANTQLGYGSNETSDRDTVPIIVVEKAGVLYGLEVDEILDTLSTDVEPDTNLCEQSGIFGNLNTSQELIVLIDPFEMISTLYSSPEQKSITATRCVSSRPLKILFVEDTVFFKKAIMAVLIKAGHHVTHANDGQDALDILAKPGANFDIIVSDIEMPRIDGFKLAQAVRSGTTHSQIPMLAISSRANSANITKGVESGFNFYMEKLKPTILLNAIADLTGAEKKVA